MATTIGDLYLGYNDGLEEWARTKDFGAFFYNHAHLIERAQSPARWLFLGKKGTGKSILGAYLVESCRNQHGLSELCSYKDFKIHELESLKTTDVAPSQYISIWKWLLLVQFGKLIRDNQALIYNENYSKLTSFFNKNFPERAINASQVVEITKKRRFTGVLESSLFKIGSEAENTAKEVVAEYTSYLSDLENVVVDLIACSEAPYLVVMDELDHRFRRTPLYHDCITGLVYAAAGLNRQLFLTGRNAKVVVMMRTDICNWLNDVDINKIKGDPEMRVEIDWGTSENLASPLYDLVLHKISASMGSAYPSPEHRDEELTKWFPRQKRNLGTKKRRLLNRTLLRPRDVITLLNLAKAQNRNSTNFSPEILRTVDLSYSNYFMGELKNELKGHIDDEAIDEVFRMLSRIGKRSFVYDDVAAYCTEHSDIKACKNPKQLLEDMFEFSIIGNGYFDQVTQSTRQKWAYKTSALGLTSIDFDLSMHIHPGLLRALGL